MKKRFISVFLLTIFIVLGAASAEEADAIHLLWDIPLSSHPMTVKQIVEEEQGIVCDYEYHKKSKSLPAYSSLNSTNDGDFLLYGYPYHFRYSDNPACINLGFDIYGSWEARQEGMMKILDGLTRKYGPTDEGRCEMYSLGSSVWRTESEDSTHEIIAIDSSSSVDYAPDALLAAWDYTQPETEINIFTTINNIKFEAWCKSTVGDRTFISITFFDSKAFLTYKPIFEQHTGVKSHRDQSTAGEF